MTRTIRELNATKAKKMFVGYSKNAHEIWLYMNDQPFERAQSGGNSHPPQTNYYYYYY